MKPTTIISKKIVPDQVSTQVVVKSLEKKAQPLIKKLSAFKIKSNNDYENAYALTKQLKELGKEADKQLATITDPSRRIKKDADLAIKAASAIFAPFQKLIVDVDRDIKNHMLEYQENLNSKKLKLNEDFEDGKIARASTYAKKASELEVSKGVRMVWQAIPKDISKTPDQYWIVDEDKIKEDLKAGKKIAGWSWEQVQTIAI